jgi:hypothetical protein
VVVLRKLDAQAARGRAPLSAVERADRVLGVALVLVVDEAEA